MLKFDRKQQNSIKQLSFNKKINEKKRIRAEINKIEKWKSVEKIGKTKSDSLKRQIDKLLARL